MFERFNPEARKSLDAAVREARRLNHVYLGTEHMLLGILGASTVASKVLAALGVEPSSVCDDLRAVLLPDSAVVETKQLPFTPRAKRALELALDHASDLGDDLVGSEHLFLGLIEEGSDELSACGVELEDTLRKVVEMNGGDPDSVKPIDPARHRRPMDLVDLGLVHAIAVVEHTGEEGAGPRCTELLGQLRSELASQLERWRAARRADEATGD